MSLEENASSDEAAREAFAKYLDRLEQGDLISISEFCDENRELEEEIREHWNHWKRMSLVLKRIGVVTPKPGFVDRELEHLDPAINIAGGPDDVGETPPPRLLQQLAAHRHSDSRYDLIHEIAKGGQGSVTKVWDRDLRRNIAMKVILKREGSTVQEDGEKARSSLERFLQEAQITAQLDHPGIVPIHELGLDSQGRVYFTMPLVRGKDFRDVLTLLREGQDDWTLARALRVIIRVCEAMAYAHSKKVVHRDLKPGNVRVGRFGESYVMDWGLARVMGHPDRHDIRVRPHDESMVMVETDRHVDQIDSPDSPMFTMDGTVLGTPAYMSPEQARGEINSVGPASDVYSVGAMLYHLLAGHMPFVPGSVYPSHWVVLDRVQNGPPESISTIDPDVAPELVYVCEKAMSRNPAERYSDMMEMARDIEAYLDNRGIPGFSNRMGYLLKLAAQRNKPAAFTAAAAALILVSLVAAFILSLKDAVSETTVALEDNKKLVDYLQAPDLVAEVEELYPLVPSHVPQIETWLENTDALMARVDVHTADVVSDSSSSEATETEQVLSHLKSLAQLRPTVAQSLVIAEGLHRKTTEDCASVWEQVRADCAASDGFEGIEIVPQLGLVPLAKNPHSGLWEFWHVLSGDRPEIDRASGEPLPSDRSGIILVLIPGARFMMGSPPNEPFRQPGEDLVEVELRPFFIGKHEVTQGQWQRLMGANPSGTRAGKEARGVMITPDHPVEQVSWFESTEFVRRLDLRLLSEAEWENACRANSPDAYSFGSDPSCLDGTENIADASFTAGTRLPGANWTDSFVFHAPVASFAANEFGLYDMHGNVAEWCQDWDTSEDPPRRKTFRGGSWYLLPPYCRSAFKQYDFPLSANFNRGLRVGRNLRATSE